MSGLLVCICFVSKERAMPREMFRRQLDIIKNAMTYNIVIMIDFNLEWSQKEIPSYAMWNYF
jgi:hypothetical protein